MMSTLTGTSIESPLESVTRTKIESPSGGALTGTAAVRALRVVLDPPVLEQHLRLEQAVELLDGQELVAQPAVKRLDVWVLPRRAGLDIAAALGFEVSARTVSRYRQQALRRPPSQSWRTFLRKPRVQHLGC